MYAAIKNTEKKNKQKTFKMFVKAQLFNLLKYPYYGFFENDL